MKNKWNHKIKGYVFFVLSTLICNYEDFEDMFLFAVLNFIHYLINKSVLMG